MIRIWNAARLGTWPVRIAVLGAFGLLGWGAAQWLAEPDRRAIVLSSGRVIACTTSGGFALPEDCVGKVRLEIVQPLAEGPIRWRTARGKIRHQKDGIDDGVDNCGDVFRAEWKPGSEKITDAGTSIVVLDHADQSLRREVYENISYIYRGTGHDVFEKGPPRAIKEEKVVAAYSLDLDRSGRPETLFLVDDLEDYIQASAKERKKRVFTIFAGIFEGEYPVPGIIDYEIEANVERDTIKSISFVGVVRPNAHSDKIALVASAGNIFSSWISLYRYMDGEVIRIKGIHDSCAG